MTRATYFIQECPVCGRRVQVRVEYLGKWVGCRHCSGRFQAADPSNQAPPPSSSRAQLLLRADQLLSLAERPEHPPAPIS